MTDLRLLAWLSPSFPVGAFAYSHGLEWAVESGAVGGSADLGAWIADLLAFGSIRNDAILVALAMREDTALHDLNDLALALSPSMERRLETAAQGTAFLDLVRTVWPNPRLDAFRPQEAAYPVALGAAAAAHGLDPREVCEAFALAFVSNLISAALRLGVVGQTAGQRAIADAMPAVRAVAADAVHATDADLGGACFRADIASMNHETQYSRLFRS